MRAAVLGHATAVMTVDVYSHPITADLWTPPVASGAPAPSAVTALREAKSPAGL